MLDKFVAYGTAVEENVLIFGGGASQFRLADQAEQRDFGIAHVEGKAGVGKIFGPCRKPAAIWGIGGQTGPPHWRPLWVNWNEISGWGMASRTSASLMCPNSVAAPLRNFRRAGVLKKRFRTSMVVPTLPAAACGWSIWPPRLKIS